MEPTVAWYKSKTLWSNAVTFLAMALALSEVTVLIPTKAMPYVAGINALLNMWLRFGTNTALGSQDRGQK